MTISPLQNNNTRLHTSLKTAEEHTVNPGWTALQHPPCSPDLVLSESQADDVSYKVEFLLSVVFSMKINIRCYFQSQLHKIQ